MAVFLNGQKIDGDNPLSVQIEGGGEITINIAADTLGEAIATAMEDVPVALNQATITALAQAIAAALAALLSPPQ